jgi:YceI-like domain
MDAPMLARALGMTGLFWLTASLPTPSHATDMVGRCSVAFAASSTLHDFEGKGPCALLEIGSPDESGAYPARAEVAVDGLATGISARDEKMREMFDAQHHPRITASFAGIDPAALRTQRPDALVFRIAIRGIERDVKARVSQWSEVPGRQASFRAEFDLSLADFELEAPVAMGFMRVEDRVHVAVDVALTAAKR